MTSGAVYPLESWVLKVTRDSTFPVINPATGAPFAEAPEASRAQLDAAMDAALAAFRPWAADVSRFLEGLAVSAYPEGPWRKARRFAHRHRAAILLVLFPRIATFLPAIIK